MSSRSARGQGVLALLFCAVALLGNSILEWSVDHDQGIGWPHNVMRNWKQSGFVALKGKLVTNEGGHGLPDSPEVYPGHRAASLYPAYFLGRWSAGPNVSMAPFFVVLCALVLVSVAYLFDWSPWGTFVAGVAVLTPGYVIWPKILDPNTNTLLLGIGYSAFVWFVMRRPQLRWRDVAALAVVTTVFSVLNWTTVFAHGQLFFYLIARRVPARRLAIYAGLAAVGGAVVVISGILGKIGAKGGGSGGAVAMLQDYMWGSGGYSGGSSASVLLTRYAFINALALAPIWLLLAAQLVKAVRAGNKNVWIAITPLVVAFVETLTLRNYFCHHPWMAAPALLLGAVLSLSALAASVAVREPVAEFSFRTVLPWAGAALSFFFAFGNIALQRANNSETNALREFVRSATQRSDLILVAANSDAAIAGELPRYRESLDRWVDTIEKAPTNSAKSLLLSSAAPGSNWISVAEMSLNTKTTDSPTQKILAWFSAHVSRRKPGDQLRLRGEYRLYEQRTPHNAGPR